MTRSSCSTVISLLNEAENLPLLYEKLADVARREPDIDWEFLFIDDGSTDESFAILEALHRDDPRVRVIRLSRNFGAHEATACGLQQASGDAAVIMSADMQDPPAVIHEFIEKWRAGNDIVWAVRRSRRDPVLKRLCASVYYRLLRMTGYSRHPALGTGSFFLITRSAMNAYNQLGERNRVTFELIAWLGFRQAMVSYERPERYRGQSKFSFGKLVKTAIDSLFAVTHFPVRVITYMGLVIAALSLTWAVWIVFDWNKSGTSVLGWASLMVAVLFLGGIMLISIGIIGEYVWRILDETRGRPSYIVMQTLGTSPRRSPDPVSAIASADE